MMLESYEELMMPLFLRLGGSEDELHMDHFTVAHGPQKISAPPIFNEASNALASAHRASLRALEEEVLAQVYAQTPQFFERLIIDLLLNMGYANRRRDLTQQIGRSRDGGVDGIIAQDPLGLDVILLQAKRLRPNTHISASQVRDFIGTLQTKKAHKGIFVTTGEFSGFARSTIQNISHRIRLIDGRELSALMVRHNLGVDPSQSYVFKTLNRSYFSGASHVASERISASSQPRR
jgi:restriction system protein